MSKQSNRSKPEYLKELPQKVYEIPYYDGCLRTSLFNRYWWDSEMNRLIMKDKRNKKYKVIHPMINKIDNTRFVHMYNINNNQQFANYDWLEFSYSIGYYLSIERYDSVIKHSKQ